MKTKTCTKCNLPKDIEGFSKKNATGTKRNSWCKECVNQNNRKHYHSSPDKKTEALDRCKKRRDRNRLFVDSYLSEHPCVDCGEDDLVVLDFDHVRGKKRNSICTLVRNGASLTTIKAEIAKCEVRCSNDHRRRHRSNPS